MLLTVVVVETLMAAVTREQVAYRFVTEKSSEHRDGEMQCSYLHEKTRVRARETVRESRHCPTEDSSRYPDRHLGRGGAEVHVVERRR